MDIALTRAEIARMMRDVSAFDKARLLAELERDVVKDQTYRLLPLGDDAAQYLRHKRKRLTEGSYEQYEGTLNKFCRYFADLRGVIDFEPPVGTERVEDFLDSTFGDCKPRTYNRHLYVLRDFFKFHVLRGSLVANPMLTVEAAKSRDVHRTTFTGDQIRAIIASQPEVRDRLALRLLLDYGLRKGSLRAIQFMHFDHHQHRITVFAKGGKVRLLPIPSKPFWHDLERYIVESQANPADFLMCQQKFIPGRGVWRYPDKPMGSTGLHNWWYRCLENAGVVAKGTQSGERMHKARHTAGQRLLDATGNLKAAQKLLGHASIATTGNLYTDWDLEQLAASLKGVLEDDDE
jgi:site-specific recombinase XerD